MACMMKKNNKFIKKKKKTTKEKTLKHSLGQHSLPCLPYRRFRLLLFHTLLVLRQVCVGNRRQRLLLALDGRLHGRQLILHLVLVLVGDAPAQHLAHLALVGNGVGRLPHELLDVLDAAHLAVNLLQDFGALLQAKDDVLLDLRKLDARRQLLELLELRVRLGEEALLVFFAAQGEQGARLVALGQHLAGNVGLLVGEDGDAALVLLELVALRLHVQNCPAEWPGGRWVSGGGSRVVFCLCARGHATPTRGRNSLVLGSDLAGVAAHDEVFFMILCDALKG